MWRLTVLHHNPVTVMFCELQACREFMALPLLPHEHIAAVFAHIAANINATTPQLLLLSAYMRDTWVTGPVFTPRDWTVYRQQVRTNSDVERWHNHLNCRAKKGEYIGDRPTECTGTCTHYDVLVYYYRLHAQNVNEPWNVPQTISHILNHFHLFHQANFHCTC